MAKGNPNDPSMQLHFVAKAWDDVDKKYKPMYIAPDATSSIRGDVYLSDDIDGTEDAATGVTAVTPLALKKLAEKIESSSEQSVVVEIDPSYYRGFYRYQGLMRGIFLCRVYDDAASNPDGLLYLVSVDTQNANMIELNPYFNQNNKDFTFSFYTGYTQLTSNQFGIYNRSSRKIFMDIIPLYISEKSYFATPDFNPDLYYSKTTPSTIRYIKPQANLIVSNETNITDKNPNTKNTAHYFLSDDDFLSAIGIGN